MIIAVILGILGLLGCILPALPGPPLSWSGMLLLYFWGGTDKAGEHMSTTLLLVWLGITIIITVLDYLVPSWFTKITGGSKYAGWGAFIGMFLGLLTIVGPLYGALIGAFVGELVFGAKNMVTSLKSSIGTFFGLLFGTSIKLAASGIMMFLIIRYL